MGRNIFAWAGAVVLIVGSVFAQATATDAPRQPEKTVSTERKPAATASEAMVAAANPLAVKAGVAALKDGGSAIDAMIVTQMVLNLVEPQSSGVGGGAFLVYHDAESGALVTLDGRETAPMAADPALFLDADGAPRPWPEVVPGGLSVGTPGTLALMKAAHDRYGRLPWARLFEPAITLAREGFAVSPRLAGALAAAEAAHLRQFPAAADYFFPNGESLKAGDILKNPEFSNTLATVAREGIAPFYEGEIGADIVAAVAGAPVNPGRLAREDLAAYKVVERPAVCQPYRGHRVCGMGPPSSGGLTVGQILGLLEHFDMPALGPDDPLAWHLFAEASKLAYADRGLYMADADFVSMPTRGLLDPAYLTTRAQLIDPDLAMGTPARAGNPPWRAPDPRAPDASAERPGTSHISIVDADGNVVSLTTTIESGFGSGLMVRGFLLNNELTDFSFAPEEKGRVVANRVEPGKRPRSSMAPTIVYGPDGAPTLTVGSPGGSRIIDYVAATLVGLLDWNMPVDQALALGHVVNRNGATDVEIGTVSNPVVKGLWTRGHDIEIRDLNSGLHAILITPDGLIGAADPRREGIAAGY